MTFYYDVNFFPRKVQEVASYGNLWKLMLSMLGIHFTLDLTAGNICPKERIRKQRNILACLMYVMLETK